MRKVVVTKTESDNKIISEIRDKFNLDEDPFNSIDDQLLLLAFTPYCKTINNKYGICDHQSLEFYGDKIFYSVIMSLLYDFFGLKQTPQFYNDLTSQLTNNRILTDLMINKSACELVRSDNYTINKTQKKFHNKCADSLEALFGVMYVNFRTKRVDYTGIIKHWLLKNTKFPFIIKKFLNNKGYKDIPVYVVNDRKKLMDEWIKYPEHKIDLKELDFAYSGIIFNSTDSIEHIFKLLNWDYNPIFDGTTYKIYGKPNGIDQIIGIGNTIENTIKNSIFLMQKRGFIVPMQNIETPFSDELTQNEKVIKSKPSSNLKQSSSINYSPKRSPSMNHQPKITLMNYPQQSSSINYQQQIPSMNYPQQSLSINYPQQSSSSINYPQQSSSSMNYPPKRSPSINYPQQTTSMNYPPKRSPLKNHQPKTTSMNYPQKRSPLKNHQPKTTSLTNYPEQFQKVSSEQLNYQQ